MIGANAKNVPRPVCRGGKYSGATGGGSVTGRTSNAGSSVASVSQNKQYAARPSKCGRSISRPTFETVSIPASARTPLQTGALRQDKFGEPDAISGDQAAAESKQPESASSSSLGLAGKRLTPTKCQTGVPGEDESEMATQETRKCAHIPCLCDAAGGQEYCGEACCEAGSVQVEFACRCSHPGCPLTFRQFAVRSTAELSS